MLQATAPSGSLSAETRSPSAQVLDFYDRNPINEQQVLAAVRRRPVASAAALTADDLFAFDQDHYGGLAAVDTLARRAGIREGSRVLDVCAGLGGPARFLAARRGCRVVALELHAGRAAGAARLTRLVRLDGLVRVVRADARALPFGTAAFDACVSQEALLHIADKAAVLAQCHRVLATGGRLAFTDWIARPSLSDGEREQLWTWMAATTLQTLEGYRTLLGTAGFRSIEAEDVSSQWRRILGERVETYRAMREETIVSLGETRYRDSEQLLAFFVRLVEDGKLGGGRFSASR